MGTQETNLNPLAGALELFYLDIQARNLSPRTLSYYREKLGRFVTWLQAQGATAPTDITAALIRRYIRELQARDLSPYTVHGFARAIKTLCFFLVREGLLTRNPFDLVRMPTLPKELLPPFTEDDVCAILTACDDATEPARERALILLLLDSGVRASELCALNVRDLDMMTGALRVNSGKGRKDRVTFVGARTRKAILRYFMIRPGTEPDAPLFVGVVTGCRLRYDGLRAILKRLGERAGVTDCAAHRYRRTFAIESLRAGMPIMQLAAMMGHGSLSVLQRYLRLLTEDLQTAHREHGPVESLLSKKGR